MMPRNFCAQGDDGSAGTTSGLHPLMKHKWVFEDFPNFVLAEGA
jgi:hypothetical protein